MVSESILNTKKPSKSLFKGTLEYYKCAASLTSLFFSLFCVLVCDGALLRYSQPFRVVQPKCSLWQNKILVKKKEENFGKVPPIPSVDLAHSVVFICLSQARSQVKVQVQSRVVNNNWS